MLGTSHTSSSSSSSSRRRRRSGGIAGSGVGTGCSKAEKTLVL